MKLSLKDIKKLVLPVSILFCAAVLFFVGLGMKSKLKKVTATYDDVPAIAVPFLMAHDSTDLDVANKVTEPKDDPTAPVSEDTLPVTEPSTGATSPMTEEPVPTDTTEAPTTEAPATLPPADPNPVAVFGEDESWFDDALFIGDSRTVGVAAYGRLGEADYFADVGLSVFSLFSSSTSDDTFDDLTLRQLLEYRDYNKIFIMLGLNECGYPLSTLIDTYTEDIEEILSYEPNAKLYILKIYGVSRDKAASASYFGPDNLTAINDRLAELADGKQIFILDPRDLFEDSEGYLIEEYTGDGVHLYGKYYDILSAWLCELSHEELGDYS